MNSGQITSAINASTKRFDEPFCVYIGKTTR
jgi:hypothetical protein